MPCSLSTKPNKLKLTTKSALPIFLTISQPYPIKTSLQYSALIDIVGKGPCCPSTKSNQLILSTQYFCPVFAYVVYFSANCTARKESILSFSHDCSSLRHSMLIKMNVGEERRRKAGLEPKTCRLVCWRSKRCATTLAMPNLS